MWNRLQQKEKLIMGVLNVTPDSFYKESRVTTDGVISRAKQMVADGADIIDVGGYSTRPGAQPVAEEDEISRITEAIVNIKKEIPSITISIDTFRSAVAEAAIKCGASIINDVSGGAFDEQMYAVAAKYDVSYVLMHMRGTLAEMQEHCDYEDLVQEVRNELLERVERAEKAGVNKIVIDPGFGFSKTLDQNYELLKGLTSLQISGYPMLVGVSRKSMIYKYLESTPEQALNATTVLNTFAIQNGADILRVHDVREANEVRLLIKKILG